MSTVDPQRLVVAAIVALAAVGSTSACSPRQAAPPHTDSARTSAEDTLELECEDRLQRLDALIERCDSQPAFPPQALHEARALRRAAGELFLNAEYRLALELMDEAFVLLEGSR